MHSLLLLVLLYHAMCMAFEFMLLHLKVMYTAAFVLIEICPCQPFQVVLDLPCVLEFVSPPMLIAVVL